MSFENKSKIEIKENWKLKVEKEITEALLRNDAVLVICFKKECEAFNFSICGNIAFPYLAKSLEMVEKELFSETLKAISKGTKDVVF